MSTSPFPPEDIRAAAGAHHELGPEYSDAVVASFLDRVDQEIAARVDERLAAAGPRPARPVEPGNRRAMIKGFAVGVAASVAVVLLVTGARPGHHSLLLLPVLAVVCAVGARWAGRHWAIHRVPRRQGPHATAGGDYRRLV
jgi:hypothetical protein